MSGLALRRSPAAGVPRPAVLLLVGAGACDLATGLLLVAAPGATLALLGIAAPAAAGVFVRFVGAFVAGVGAAYLYPWLLAPRPGRLAAVMEVTALIRGGVALFVTGAVAAGALEPRWLAVAAVDGALAAAQVVMLRRGGSTDG